MIRYKDNKGFSLIELIVVIAIMAVMLGIIGYSLSMLFGAEARQGARKMDAQLNDIKTGAMSRAAEYMVVRYIDPTGNEEAYSKKGVDRPGYYAEKHISTIQNADTIKVAEPGAEYSRIGSSKVTIALGSGETLSSDGTNAFMIEYKRSTGELERIEVGTVSAGGAIDGEFTKTGEVQITEDTDIMTFTSGMKTYTIRFEEGTGKHTVE